MTSQRKRLDHRHICIWPRPARRRRAAAARYDRTRAGGVSRGARGPPVGHHRPHVQSPERELSVPKAAPPPTPISASTAVLFTKPAERLQAMTVALGPCVALPGRKQSLASVHAQQGFETTDQTCALFAVLTEGSPDGQLLLHAREGDSALYRFSDAFVDAMARANQELQRLAHEDESRGDRDLTAFAARRAEWDAAWLEAVEWPPNMVSTSNRLLRVGMAELAKQKNQPMFVWYRPRVPEYTVISGSGPYPDKGE